MKQFVKKLNKEEFKELCKLLISDSEDDFQLGLNMSKEFNMRWGISRLTHLDSLSGNKWDFNSGRGLTRKYGIKHPNYRHFRWTVIPPIRVRATITKVKK